MSTTMDEILKGEDSEAEAPETTEEEAKASDESEGTEESTEEEPAKGEEKAEPPAAESKPTVPLEALLDEREKRQELRRELDGLKAKPAAAPDFNEDPEAAFKHLQQTVDQQANTRFINMSMEMARSQHDDFDEVMKDYKSLAQNTPGLHEQALKAPHPGEFAYQAVRRHQQLSEVGDIDEFRKKAFEEGRAAALAEIAKKPRSDLPESLASERSVGGRKGPEWAGPTPMEAILAPKN